MNRAIRALEIAGCRSAARLLQGHQGGHQRLLTEVAIRNAAPKAKRYKMGDGHGLYLEVLPTGSRSWRWKYSFAGLEKRLTLGPWPLITLKRARELRDEARLQLLQGIDPGSARRATRARVAYGETFEAIARSWHESKKPALSPRYAAHVLARLEANVFPHFGRMKIGEVTPPIVLEMVRRIEARGAPTMAHEVRGHVSEVFVWAIAAGLAETDPAAIIRRALAPAGGGRRPALLRIEEATELIRRIDGVKRATPSVKLASRLLALTAVRPGPLRLAEKREFEDIDGPAPLWRIPAAKMKLSVRNKANPAFDFVVPLSRQAAETVRAALEIGRGPMLFPGVHRGKAISDSTLSQIYLDAGYRGRHVPHGWRASFSTIMNERAAREGRAEDRAIIDLMLAHMASGVEAAYNRAAYMARRRELAQEWADLLFAGIGPAQALLNG